MSTQKSGPETKTESLDTANIAATGTAHRADETIPANRAFTGDAPSNVQTTDAGPSGYVAGGIIRLKLPSLTAEELAQEGPLPPELFR